MPFSSFYIISTTHFLLLLTSRLGCLTTSWPTGRRGLGLCHRLVFQRCLCCAAACIKTGINRLVILRLCLFSLPSHHWPSVNRSIHSKSIWYFCFKWKVGHNQLVLCMSTWNHQVFIYARLTGFLLSLRYWKEKNNFYWVRIQQNLHWPFFSKIPLRPQLAMSKTWASRPFLGSL